MESTLDIAVVGHRGYAGQAFHALAMQHPNLRPRPIDARDPHAGGLEACRNADAVVLATPADAARLWTPALRNAGLRVLDLSDAHRQHDGVHYGIPEIFGAPAPDADLVANPGCYPTASLLALRPLLDAGVVAAESIAIMGASGTSGAGKALRDDLHFSAMHANVFPYKVGEHRHTPEIERHLGAPVSFVPTLLPIVRGMLITAFVRPAGAATPADLLASLHRHYEAHPFVHVLPRAGIGLSVRHVVGRHEAVVAVGPEARSGLVPVFCAIDNLMRGAASQALHNLNLWMQLPPYRGLPAPRPVPLDGPPQMTGLS